MVDRSNAGVVYNAENNASTSNCKVIKRLKAENSYKKSRARQMSSRSDMSVASSACNSAASSCVSVSSHNRRRNREALLQQRVQALSIEPFSGLSTSTKPKKPPKPSSSPRKWFKRRRDNKVADSSSSTSESRNPASILRNNKHLSLSGMEDRDPPPGNGGPSVRFAEGTVFQDPCLLQRRRVPRTKDRLRKQRQKTSVVHLVNRALPLFRDMACSRMACV